MTVPAGIAAATPAQNVRPSIAHSTLTNLRPVLLESQGRPTLLYPVERAISVDRCLWPPLVDGGPSHYLALRLVAPSFDNSNPLGRPDGGCDRQARIPSYHGRCQTGCSTVTFTQ